MPLSFNSASHGNIAFGFFNINSDMLLLEHYFFYADDFCNLLSSMAQNGFNDDGSINQSEYQIKGFYIDKSEDIGDLMGAIHGIRFEGFIGELYKKFPFPQKIKNFKQDPKGIESRSFVGQLIQQFSKKNNIVLTVFENKDVKFCDFIFSRKVFFELINYVWQGGYPRWKDEIRPPYVTDMKNSLVQSGHPFFKGITFQSS